MLWHPQNRKLYVPQGQPECFGKLHDTKKLSTVARSQAKWPEKQGSVREQEEAFLFVTMADQLPGYDAKNPLPPSGEG
jgi:hypothetical protein